MKKRWIWTACSVVGVMGLFGAAYWSSVHHGAIVSKTSDNASREIASFCHPSLEDVAVATRIAKDPGTADEKYDARIRAQVQTYVYIAELAEKFDRAVKNPFTRMKKILVSDDYRRLKILQEVRRQIRHELEALWMVQLDEKLKEKGNVSREKMIVDDVARVENELTTVLEDVTAVSGHNLYTKLAELDIRESFQDLRDYYVNCDYRIFDSNFLKRMPEHEKTVADIRKHFKRKANAYEEWTPNEKGNGIGIDVGAWVEKNLNALKEAQASEQRAPDAARIYPAADSHGSITGYSFPANTWAMTYDDGPGLTTTPKFLDQHKALGVPGTFFVLGNNLKSEALKTIVLREYNEGHTVAVHTFSHPQVPKLSAERRVNEILGAKEFFEKTIPGYKAEYFRLPYGAGLNVPSVRQVIADAKLIHVFWNVDTLDWQDKNPESVFKRAVAQIEKEGHGIILMHDIHPQSVIASKMVIEYLQKKGKRVMSIPAIVNEINAQ